MFIQVCIGMSQGLFSHLTNYAGTQPTLPPGPNRTQVTQKQNASSSFQLPTDGQFGAANYWIPTASQAPIPLSGLKAARQARRIPAPV